MPDYGNRKSSKKSKRWGVVIFLEMDPIQGRGGVRVLLPVEKH